MKPIKKHYDRRARGGAPQTRRPWRQASGFKTLSVYDRVCEVATLETGKQTARRADGSAGKGRWKKPKSPPTGLPQRAGEAEERYCDDGRGRDEQTVFRLSNIS